MGTIALYDAKCSYYSSRWEGLGGYGNGKILVAHYLKKEPTIFHKDVDSI